MAELQVLVEVVEEVAEAGLLLLGVVAPLAVGAVLVRVLLLE